MSIIILILFAAITIPKYIQYRLSDYRKRSGQNFIQTGFVKKRYARYLTYRETEKIKPIHEKIVNLTIETKDQTNPELELLILTTRGMILVSTCHNSNWIYGSERDEQWISALSTGKEKVFENPLLKHHEMISGLKRITGRFNRTFYRSIVIFDERTTFKDVKIQSRHLQVIKRSELKNELTQLLTDSHPILKHNELNQIIQRLNKQVTNREPTDKETEIVSLDSYRKKRDSR